MDKEVVVLSDGCGHSLCSVIVDVILYGKYMSFGGYHGITVRLLKMFLYWRWF